MANLRADNLTGTGGRNAIDGSLCFDGSGANEVGYPGLALADSDDWHFDGDFTMEGWIKRGKPVPTAAAIVGQWESSGGTDRNAAIYLNNQNKLIAYQNRSTTNYSVISASALEQDVWYHFAFVLQGSNLRLYMNGVQTQATSVSGTQNNSTATFFVGGEANSNNALTYSFGGCLSNIRVIKGTALYEDGTTFTPPTEKLTAVAGTVLLCCQDSKDATQEATGKTIVPVGGRLPSGNNTIVQNGDFSAGTHAWFGDSGASISASGGVATVTNGGGDNLYAIKQQGVFTIGRRYRVTGTVNATFSGDSIFRVRAGGNAESWSITNKLTSGTAFYFDTGTITADDSPLEIGSGGDGSSSTITQFTLQDVKVYAEDFNPGDNVHPPVGVDEGVVFDGDTKINSQGYMYFPTGNTLDRGRSSRGVFGGGYKAPWGTSDNLNSFEYFNIQSTGNAVDFGDRSVVMNQGLATVASSTRGVMMGGRAYAYPSAPTNTSTDTIDYVTIANTGDAIDFGNLVHGSTYIFAAGSNSTRGVIFRSSDGDMEYVTIATTGNSVDTGSDSTVGRNTFSGFASQTRAFWAGGANPSSGAAIGSIDYLEIASLGVPQDFGDLTFTGHNQGAASNTRGIIFTGGFPSTPNNTINYITMASTGDATDFGDTFNAMPDGHSAGSGCSNSIRAVRCGGYVGPNASQNWIDYVTIQSTGNGVDFGDLITIRHSGSGFSDSHGGL